MLADTLNYQLAAVRKALDPANLRTRILLADAVGLGKTLEIGMILAELIRRGRGERILIVSPRHVLEQMQHEMWCRFAIPFVRLDSVGIQRVRQKLPATRNPFTYFRRAISSIDTLKSDRYLAALRHHWWDAVVIDESHNLTDSETQNNRLARVLALNTDAFTTNLADQMRTDLARLDPDLPMADDLGKAGVWVRRPRSIWLTTCWLTRGRISARDTSSCFAPWWASIQTTCSSRRIPTNGSMANGWCCPYGIRIVGRSHG